jgi:hypothetical protein
VEQLNNSDRDRIEILLAEYERGQEIGHHTDGIIHEVTSIVWGANTLLLGFILEVSCDSTNQILVIVSAVVGILMSAYVPWVHHLTKRIQRIAYDVCRKIEDEAPLPHRLNILINADYPKWKPGLVAVWVLTAVFVAAWLGVIVHAGICLCHSK